MKLKLVLIAALILLSCGFSSASKEVNLLDKNLKSIPPAFGVTN